ncbi:hypothetical protein NDU88_006440 [Pleurodeles waltl]|uniref:Secreted protein n=1 Tax=Pleurodeles waltl TaxID=8319 RepID=A0AAV7RPJ3_PLEWA|nr:hypothetical protein NDU88_006440 [Pleurodeles waltl]
MSRVCAWIFLLVLRLRVGLRGCASKLRSHGRRRINFSSRLRSAGLCVEITISRQASLSFKHKYLVGSGKISSEGHKRRGAWKKGVCVDFSPAHTDLRRYFPRGEVGVFFRRSDSLFLWIAGITRCPGSVRGFSCLFSGCASVCGAARRNYDLTAGVASISPLDFDLRGCALKLRSHGRRRVDFSSRGRAALSLRGRASDLRSSQERRVDQRQSAAFFSPRDKLCVEIFGARSIQVKERSLFGPETSRNRRQALSKPLESTFTARQEFSKAAGQQQGSSPL